MKLPHGITAIAIVGMMSLVDTVGAEDPGLTQRRAVEAVMLKANLYYQNNFPLGTAVWNRSAYHIGNLRSWQYLGLRRDLDYAISWSTANNWTRGPEGAAHADAHCSGQVYLDLFRQDPRPVRAANTKTTMDALVGLPAATDDWWWIDAFFMAAPTFAKLGVIDDQPGYFSQMEAMYLHMKSTRQLFDPTHGLWFRDAAAKGRTGPNTPEFWGRGNGWVIAACARLLEELPAGDPRRAEFGGMLQTMAAALVPWQGEDGFWRSNLKFPNHFANPETSCTAFFTYALAYGINAGILDAATYTPVVMKAWNGMVATALHSSGKLGYVQAIGLDPKASSYEGDQDYGYGALLLAGVEILKLLGGPPPVTAVAATPRTAFDADGNYAETVRLDGSATVVRDANPVIMSWWHGSTFLGEGPTLETTFPLGTHSVTLKVEHADDLPNTATTQVRVEPRARIQPNASASGFEPDNVPANVLDGNPSTRWSHFGSGQWLQLDLPQPILLDRLLASFHLGDTRVTYFDISLSTNGSTWQQVFTGQSSGTTNGIETFIFSAQSARHIRYIGRGNSSNLWNSVTELMLPLVPVATASGFQSGNPPANALDHNLNTRWSHQGIGQWLQLELAHSLPLDEIEVAFYLGDTRVSYFDIAVSTNGSTWEQVFTGQSGGGSNGLETFRFPSRNARYLRYIGKGNSTSDWNSVTEIRLPVAEALDAADPDANGLPDSWEIHHFGSTGLSPDFQSAYLTGLDGANPSTAAWPVLRLEPDLPSGPRELSLDTRAAFGPGYLGKIRKHRILTSPDMAPGAWQPLPNSTDIPADNLEHVLPIGPPDHPAAFYRASTWLETEAP